MIDFSDNLPKNKKDDVKLYDKEIALQIQKLHNMGILHDDLHGNNIVINPENGDVKIIDFGNSYFFEEIDDDVINELNSFLEREEPFNNLEDVLLFELGMYKRDL